MAPWVPRMHLFEIDDQSWFPASLRAQIQNGLTECWTLKTPLQSTSPAKAAASQLMKHLGEDLSSYTYIDFCAGSGGPTPSIERAVNKHLKDNGRPQVDFVLSDLHPNIEAWKKVASQSPRLNYESRSIDASSAPKDFVQRGDGKKVMRLFNLAFHHFDDPLARDILRDTVKTSEGFAIFELQTRDLASFLTISLLGVGIMLTSPYWAWKWRSPSALLYWTFLPIVPFVLIFDGYISALRTRTPDEVEALLRSCGEDTSDWVVRSGQVMHMWPCGSMHYIICRPEKRD